jgi:uridine kinase
MADRRYVIGVSGRSGSGKSTFVRRIMEYFGSDMVCLHTMDNYYLPSEQQVADEKEFLNFDLPTSFDRDKFHSDLEALRRGEQVQLAEYEFTNENPSNNVFTLYSAPIILVEGLFVYHYKEINKLLDFKVMIQVTYDKCYNRRLNRDLKERNYSEDQTNYRYNAHVEPAYKSYIEPYVDECDLKIDNEQNLEAGLQILVSRIKNAID